MLFSINSLNHSRVSEISRGIQTLIFIHLIYVNQHVKVVYILTKGYQLNHKVVQHSGDFIPFH